MISKNKYGWLLFAFLLVCLLPRAEAQIYPGDANNDGIVNNLDILYIGYAYGSIGPIRPETSPATETDIALPWAYQFPDSVNYAFADANGSGQVDFEDFLLVFRNYGQKRLNPTPQNYTKGTGGFDPALYFGTPQSHATITPGATVEIPIYLQGTFGDSLVDVNGISFSLEFDGRIIKTAQLDFSDSWLTSDSAAYAFQIPVSNNRLDAALTRYGKDPIIGKGLFGKLRAVIEDDLIGLLVRDTLHTVINIKYTKLKDGNFIEIPVVTNGITIVIHDPDAIAPTKDVRVRLPIEISPNPAHGQIQIISPQAIQCVELYNALGQRLWQRTALNESTFQLILPTFVKGTVFLKIYTAAGVVTRKILLE